MLKLKGGIDLNKLAKFVVNHKKFILILYAVLILLSLFSMNFTSINYDLSSYLPSDMNSIKGRNILENEFKIKGTASVLLEDKPYFEVQNIKDKISKVKGVKSAVWLDDAEDIKKAESFMDESIKKEFVSGKYSLIQVQFDDDNDSLNTKKALSEIEEIIGDSGLIGGPAAVSKDVRETTDREMTYYSIAAFIIILIILFMAMSSFIEPILFFIAIGTAILLNAGTNFIFKSISSTTYSAASILQLAVSMDYSIFLLHRFIEEKNNCKNKDEAMIEAIKKTFDSISASALTTICGFLALIVMKYGIGRDIGLVLSKGVLFSLITVITLLPCLILLFDDKIEKHQHKIYLPNFNKSSKWLIKHRYVSLIIAIIIAVPAFLAQSNLKYYYANEKTLPPTSISNISNSKINDIFSNQNKLIMIVPKDNKLKETELMDSIEKIDNVKEVAGLYSAVDKFIPDSFIPKEAKDNFESDKYSYFIITLNSELEGKNTKDAINKIRNAAKGKFNEWYLTGEAAIYSDLEDVTSKDFVNVTILSIILIGIIILITFKSISIPLILIFVIELGIWINLSIPYFQGKSLNFISFIIIGAIQLGATVDYAILFTSRYKENIEVMPKYDAAVKTIKDTGRSILTSSLILIAGTPSVSFITSIRSASELTLLIGRGAIISLILVLTVLPTLLMIFNGFIKLTTYKWPKEIK